MLLHRFQYLLLVSLVFLILTSLPASADWSDSGWTYISNNSSSSASGQGTANYYTSPPSAVTSANNHSNDGGNVKVYFARLWTPYTGATTRTFNENSEVACNAQGGVSTGEVKGLKTNTATLSYGSIDQHMTGMFTTGAEWFEQVQLTSTTYYYGLTLATVDSN